MPPRRRARRAPIQAFEFDATRARSRSSWGGGLALLLMAGGWTYRFMWLLPLARIDATLPLGGLAEHDGVEEGNEVNKARDMTILLLATNLGLHGLFVWGRYKVFRIGSHTPAGVRVIEVSACTCILLDLG